jgi:hypothetical protein
MIRREFPIPLALFIGFVGGSLITMPTVVWWWAQPTREAGAASHNSAALNGTVQADASVVSPVSPVTIEPHPIDRRNRECFPEYVAFDGGVDRDDSCILQSDWTVDERLFCAKYRDNGEIVMVPGAPRRCLAWAIDEDGKRTRDEWAAEGRRRTRGKP